jgi:hypothetical protein
MNVEEYLGALPLERRAALSAVREVILKNLDKGFEEGIQYGMIGYYLPHSVYPPGYHCDPKKPLPLAALGAQKSHLALHLMFLYGDEEALGVFQQAYAASGKKLDMGKGCLRFKKLEDLPLDVIGQAFARVSLAKWTAANDLARESRKKKKG